MRKATVKVGDEFPVMYGDTAVIVEYNNCRDVYVKFKGYDRPKLKVNLPHMRRGTIKNPYRLSVHGVGYMGVGEYGSRSDGGVDPAYQCWTSMMSRCYSYAERYKNYKDVEVCKEWHNFQVFAEWWHSKYKEKGWHLDKDMINIGNREYNPDSCSFIPVSINVLMERVVDSDRSLPKGVTKHGNSYRARVALETFPVRETPEEASKDYQENKLRHAKTVVETLREILDPRIVYNVHNWSFE